ncbi:hypothetical protein BCR34DRAFT_18008 [Clohesyomyces aquaticus]|uniref:SH3 domain-containing protein n=1 Tax=Clohesyomyces aquaticus TaxID=1231657 RepID=A0A1Y1ZBH4_9PLEO|nr:hypothetical protein BCR34DRAFT_18008 [Clohesyomyces aquaticus]
MCDSDCVTSEAKGCTASLIPVVRAAQPCRDTALKDTTLSPHTSLALSSTPQDFLIPTCLLGTPYVTVTMAESFNNAMTKRSLRAIKTELEFLVDSNVITSQQYDAIINQLPGDSTRTPQPTNALPVPQMANLNIQREHTPEPDKKVGYYAENTSAANIPPPAYPTPPIAPTGPPALAHATAMYQYNAQDAGDLALMPNDKVVVTEYMNNEWWKGRNERTGQEGIFPASYVRREEKSMMPASPMPMATPQPQPSNYGNMPLDVSNGAASAPHQPGKGEEMGKKFGKKLGNAAIFGAGATIGKTCQLSLEMEKC